MALDQAWVHQFNEGFKIQLQQTSSRLMPTINGAMIHRGVKGAIDYHDRLGAVMLNDVVSPYGQMNPLTARHTRRGVLLVSSAGPLLNADEDRIRMMTDPNDGYRQILLAAAQRRFDKHILDAAIGSAMTVSVSSGSAQLTYSTQAMVSGHQIGGATAIDLARIINAGELLSRQGAGVGRLTFAYSPGQRRNIMAITQASSSDFTRNRLHDKGTIDGEMWEGFNWIEIADVMQEDTSTVLHRMLALSGTTRSCIAYNEYALGFSIGKDVQTSVSIRHDLEAEPTQIRVSLAGACVRVWEGGVVQVDCLEN